MAGAYRRKGAARYRVWFTGADGRRHWAAGFADRKASLDLANDLERQSRYEREGLAEPGERHRRAAAARPVADHVADWRLHLLAKGDTPAHARHSAGVAARILADAGVEQLPDLTADRIQASLGRFRVKHSPRTVNHALGAVKAWCRWMHAASRLRELPRGVMELKPLNQEVDRRRVRRALTPDEFARLCAAAEAGPDLYLFGPTKSKIHKFPVTGAERALLYRVAAGTGFRANEIRCLRVGWFKLDADAPEIVIPPEATKNRKGAEQPIRPALAAMLRARLAGRDPAEPAFTVPTRTGDMIAADLARAGIAFETADGFADFHSLRAYYVTDLVRRGADPTEAQRLARHSDVRLTLGLYTKKTKKNLRDALGEE